MSGYLLDTNVLAELRKRDRCHPGVAAWFETIDDTEIFTSVLVAGEIRRGIEWAKRKDPRKALVLENWLNGLLAQFHDRVLSVDSLVAEQWGKLCVEPRLPDVDGLIAATALTHSLTLVTRNTEDFVRSGVPLFNPFHAS